MDERARDRVSRVNDPVNEGAPLDDVRLKSWLDGELPPAEAEEVEAELRRSPPLRARAADFRRVAEALRGAGARIAAPDPCPATVLLWARRLETDEWRTLGWLKKLAAVAAALLVGALAILSEHSPSSRLTDEPFTEVRAAKPNVAGESLDLHRTLSWSIDLEPALAFDGSYTPAREGQR